MTQLKPLHCLLIIALWWSLLPASSRGDDRVSIYFYNPDISITRNTVLKELVDQYLREHGEFEFQPVTDVNTFETLLIKPHRRLFMMPSWHFKQWRTRQPNLVAYLVGKRNASIHYHKLLIRTQIEKHLGNKQSLVIAAAGNVEFVRALLAAMLAGHPDLLTQYQLLTVPKDIDALMAVTFGMADAALSSEQGLATLVELYPNQRDSLKVLAKSPPLLHMQVVAPRRLSDHEQALLEAIEQMSLSSRGRQTLSMLGLEDWAPLHATDPLNPQRTRVERP